MKRKLAIYAALIIAGMFSFQASNAQVLIQFWDFNQIRPLDGTGTDSMGTTFSYVNTLAVDSGKATWPLTPAYSKVAGAKIVYYRPQYRYWATQRDSTLEGLGPGGAYIYDYSSNHYAYFATSDSGFTEGNAFLKARNPSDSNEVWLYIPTTGYKGISLQYALSQSSGKGATYNIFSYSTNGPGGPWKHLTTAMDTFNIGGIRYPDTMQADNPITAGSGWYPVQIDFSSDPTVNDNPNFILRFRLAGASTLQGSGNDRYDNFAVWAAIANTGIDEITVQGNYSIYPNPSNKTVTISGTYPGRKVVSIYNTVGQEISTSAQYEGKQTQVDVSNLSNGIYFICVKEADTGNTYTIKFVKE
jgi:hypothetical protein